MAVSNALNKKILLFYSGGIDSTFMVISFLKALSKQDVKDKLVIAMSLDAIHENPNFYHNIFLPKIV
jgi:PP-loop superfamily ATP-utilizing enzyme